MATPEEITIETIETAEGRISPTDPTFLAVVKDLTDEQKTRLTSFVNAKDKAVEQAEVERIPKLATAEGTIY